MYAKVTSLGVTGLAGYIVQVEADLSGGLPQFNLDAKISAVSMDYDLKQCANGIEDEMLRKISSALGTNGFVLGEGGIFTSEAGTAISMGYSDGIFKIAYFMNTADAQPLPRQARK